MNTEYLFFHVGNANVSHPDESSVFDNRHRRTRLEGGVKNLTLLFELCIRNIGQHLQSHICYDIYSCSLHFLQILNRMPKHYVF
jgi:hypothetical protein